jgi:hypothetical protein
MRAPVLQASSRSRRPRPTPGGCPRSRLPFATPLRGLTLELPVVPPAVHVGRAACARARLVVVERPLAQAPTTTGRVERFVVQSPPSGSRRDVPPGLDRPSVLALFTSSGFLFTGPVSRLRLGLLLLALATLPLLAPPIVNAPLVGPTALGRAEGSRPTRHGWRRQRTSAVGTLSRAVRPLAAARSFLRLFLAVLGGRTRGAVWGRTGVLPPRWRHRHVSWSKRVPLWHDRAESWRLADLLPRPQVPRRRRLSDLMDAESVRAAERRGEEPFDPDP